MGLISSLFGLGKNRTRGTTLRFAAFIIILGAGQQSIAEEDGQTTAQSGPPAAAVGMLPTRVEFGGYQQWVDEGLGNWRGLNAEVWLGRTSRFTAGFLLDSQTRPTGTQQDYAFLSYMNWTPSFYTIQSVSGAPQRSDSAVYFPEVRYDVKFNWKLPPDKSLILGAGFTHFDFGGPIKGEIYNIGALYYHGKIVVEGDLFINQSRPGDLTSASGSLSLQYGTEGRYWFGVTASGGRELYRIVVQTPLDVRLMSYTLDLFYRRWITRHVGYLVGATYQDKLNAYRRGGISARVFFEF